MKTKSFLFLIAALALGLAFAGCGEDSTTTTNNVPYDRWNSIQSDVDRINTAFDEGAEVVKLDGNVQLVTGDVLIIPAGKKLDLDTYTLNDSGPGYVVIKGTVTKAGTNAVMLSQSYIIADGSYLTANVGTMGAEKLFNVPVAGSAVVYGAVTAPVFATGSLDTD